MPKPQPASEETDSQAETKPVEPITFSYDGQDYEVPGDFGDSVEFHEHIEDGNFVLMIRAALGGRQWSTFKSKPRTYAATLELANAFSAAAGWGK